jgi:hypothetical protein
MIINLVIPTLIISCIALLLSTLACIAFVAQRMSTHKIEWRPLVQEKIEQELEEEDINLSNDDDKILNEALYMSRKKKKEVDPLDEVLETANYRN